MNKLSFFASMPVVFIIINGLLILFLYVGYLALILKYQHWFRQLKTFVPEAGTVPRNSFSVIIPARNEQQNIENCICSIQECNYPPELLEILVVDDFSADATPELVKKLALRFPNVRLLQLSDFVDGPLNSYKKKSIEIAIGYSRYDWIVTTDADCTVPSRWLELYDRYIQSVHPVFIAAPVMFTKAKSFVSVFQSLDFISLQGITAASVSAGFHSMCNGANLCYQKSVFQEAGGFRGIDQLASGDDMLLMNKIKQLHPGGIGYLFHPAATVRTIPMKRWGEFLNQRIRWASKASGYQEKKIFRVLLLVYLLNLYLLVLPFFAFAFPAVLLLWLVLLAGKVLVELIFMFPVADFFGERTLLAWFPLMQPFHIVYTVVSGFLGKFGKYQWKGRTVK